jgi:hypothetical protein
MSGDVATTSVRRRNWDAVAAVIASLIGLLALCVSAYTANVQRQQAKAQVWTRLFFASSDPGRALLVMNKGVGPARIESVRMYVDGKAQRDWPHVFAALGLPPREDRVQSTLNGIVVAANERVDFLVFADAKDWADFRAQASRASLRACYCSVLDECLVFDERSARGSGGALSSHVRPAAQCERNEAEEFQE